LFKPKGGIAMNIQRAQEIATSPVMANVTYNGTPIYIQHVDENNETARIYPLNEPQNEQDVPLNSLNEG
jgi:small acid-soluble spore protein H (minor)